jgi:hypothetical protein
MTPPSDDGVTERIRAEYLEMPGMSLRLEQVQRLCGLEQSICKKVLDSLVAVNFLYEIRRHLRAADRRDQRPPPIRQSSPHGCVTSHSAAG